MDATVNVGLGSGSRDRDIAMLMQILMQQKEVISLAGPFNPICGIDKVVNTMRKVVETAGIRNADAYFSEVSPEEAKQWMQENMNPEQGPSEAEKVAMVKAQADLQLEQMRAQTAAQQEQMRVQMAAHHEQLKAQSAAMKEKAQMEADLMVKRAELEVQERLKGQEMQFKAQEFAAQQQLEREKMAQQMQIEFLKLGVQSREVDEETGEAKPHMFDDMTSRLVQASVQANAQTAQMTQQAIAQGLAEMQQNLLRAVTAPKRVVRGPDGRALGVETVMES